MSTLSLITEGIIDGVPKHKVRKGFLVWEDHFPFSLGTHQDVFGVIVGPEITVHNIWVDEKEPGEVIWGG